VELLHSHTTTQSHWSSGSTICFLPRGAAVCVPRMHPHFWNWDLRLGMSPYIGDPDMIPDHQLWSVLFARDLVTALATPIVTDSLTAGSHIQSNTLVGSCKAQDLLWGGGACGAHVSDVCYRTLLQSRLLNIDHWIFFCLLLWKGGLWVE
jgi:hypothetical protein